VKVKLDTGFVTGSKKPEMVEALRQHHRDARPVELVTEASSDPSKFFPRLKEILPVASPTVENGA
jgi:hypothetical protein